VSFWAAPPPPPPPRAAKGRGAPKPVQVQLPPDRPAEGIPQISKQATGEG